MRPGLYLTQCRRKDRGKALYGRLLTVNQWAMSNLDNMLKSLLLRNLALYKMILRFLRGLEIGLSAKLSVRLLRWIRESILLMREVCRR